MAVAPTSSSSSCTRRGRRRGLPRVQVRRRPRNSWGSLEASSPPGTGRCSWPARGYVFDDFVAKSPSAPAPAHPVEGSRRYRRLLAKFGTDLLSAVYLRHERDLLRRELASMVERLGEAARWPLFRTLCPRHSSETIPGQACRILRRLLLLQEPGLQEVHATEAARRGRCRSPP